MKKSNAYVNEVGGIFADTPKAVFAALAFSLAMRLSEDNPDAARELLASEWATLHSAGIVPQKPGRILASRRKPSPPPADRAPAR